ncbi:transporter substrate-binding domain-containing protein [Marinibacterium profundimaris]|uniref:transporter substrate-binding domain-containing protein n=1 Tax=Marinibacterium profundimaris TaxID=1679460 RepID=UPI0013035DEC|nr:transporter substrate-binding domain-containing protein [Marinibacterium profundimaris]
MTPALKALGLSFLTLMAAPVMSTAQDAPSLNGTTLPQYAAPEGGLVAEIQSRGKIVNGIEAQNPPFEYVDNGEIVGFDIEVTNLFAESLGVEAEFIDTAWSGVIPSLYTDKFDMIWSAMTITEPRKEAVSFSKPYASDKVEFIVQAGNTEITSLEDLNGKVLGTQLNSAAEFQAQQLIEEHDLDIELKSFDSFQGAYLDLRNGNVDAVTSTQLNNRVLFEANPGVYEVAIGLPIYNFVGVAIRKQDSDLLEAVNTFLDAKIASGELAALQEKWFGYAMDLPGE